MKTLKFMATVCAAVGLLISAGCKSDCEKAYANIESWSKDSKEAKEMFDDMSKKGKDASIAECEKELKEGKGEEQAMIKCMATSGDMKAAAECMQKAEKK